MNAYDIILPLVTLLAAFVGGVLAGYGIETLVRIVRNRKDVIRNRRVTDPRALRLAEVAGISPLKAKAYIDSLDPGEAGDL